MSPDRPLPRPRQSVAAFKAYRTQQQPAEVRIQANEWAEPTAAGRYVTSEDLERTLVNRYPDNNARRLREILADQYDVEPDQLVIGNGSNEGILNTFLIFGGAGRTVLYFTPTYTMYGRVAQVLGMTIAAEPVGLPYELDAARVRIAVEDHRPDLICLCSPNNPTGNLVPQDAILAAAEEAPEALVLVDEAYAEFAGTTMLPYLPSHPNLALSKTFSKVRGAAGLRVGVLVLHPKVAEIFDAVRLPYNLSTTTQLLAERIAADLRVVGERVALVSRERDRVEQRLRRHQPLEVFPSVTNFVLFRHRERKAADLHAAILAEGVLVRDVSSWPGADECLRATIGTPTENARFLAAMDRVLAPAAVG